MQKRGDISEDMNEKFEAADRISELPTFIIHHILSFLKQKDLAKTSVLSKRWNNLRASFPILIFDQREFHKDLSFLFSNDRPEIIETREKFMTFVDGSLRSFCEQGMCLEKFALYMTLDLKLAFRVDKWVGLAMENNVKELIIGFNTTLKERYHLPEIVFATKSITSLNITCCKVELPFGNLIKFRSLQRLSLSSVYVADDMIQNFVRSCPLIKIFYLHSSWGFKSLRLSGLSYLENVSVSPVLGEFKEVCVEAPRLKLFFFRTVGMHNSCIINVAASQDLKRLCISYFYITEQLLYDLICKFPNLEELTVAESRVLERIAISSLKLKTLVIQRCSKLMVAEIDAPNLHAFKYRSGDSKMPILSSTSALCQWEINLCVRNVNTDRFLKLREFLNSLNCKKFLNLEIQFFECMFDLEELIKKPLHLPYELEYLTLGVSTVSSNFSAFVDGLFWCYHPKILSIISDSGSNNAFIKSLGEKVKDIEVRSCCCSSQIKCWLHYLEEVTIESFEGTSNERFHDWNTLLDALPTLAKGQKFCFRFTWCSYLV